MHPVSKALCILYNELFARHIVAFPLADVQKHGLDSTVKTVESSYFGKVRFPDPKDKAAAYFTLLIKDHNVTDGNKRLAVVMLEVYCEAHDLALQLPERITLDVLAVSVAASHQETEGLIADVRKILFGSKQ